MFDFRLVFSLFVLFLLKEICQNQTSSGSGNSNLAKSSYQQSAAAAGNSSPINGVQADLLKQSSHHQFVGHNHQAAAEFALFSNLLASGGDPTHLPPNLQQFQQFLLQSKQPQFAPALTSPNQTKKQQQQPQVSPIPNIHHLKSQNSKYSKQGGSTGSPLPQPSAAAVPQSVASSAPHAYSINSLFGEQQSKESKPFCDHRTFLNDIVCCQS